MSTKDPLPEMAKDQQKDDGETGSIDKKVLEDPQMNVYTEEEFKRLRRKVDRFLLPLMWVCYGVQQADKTGISTQATFGIREDTNLVGQQFSWLSTIFYLAYMCCEFPSNFIMQRVNIGQTLSCLMFIWGVIVLCTAFAKNFAHLMVLRALQGAAECTISPSFLLIIGSWYLTREHASRSIIWGSANAGFAIICDLCLYGIGKHMEEKGGMSAWKGISFFLGAITIALSIVCFFMLGTPREVRWLSAEEKAMASARVAQNKTGSDKVKRPWKWYQVKLAFMDPQTYFFFFTTLANTIPNGGVTSFGNLVYVSFGFTNLETLLKGMVPRNVLSVAWFLFVGWATLRWPQGRFWIMMSSVFPGFVGFLALALLPPDDSYQWQKWGMFFMSVLSNVTGLLIWTFIPSNIAGRTKKSVTSSILFVAYCVGNSVGAQVFREKDAPRYIPAIITCSVLYITQFVLMFLWRLYYVTENKRRDKKAREANISEEQRQILGVKAGENDESDFLENQHFRYTV